VRPVPGIPDPHVRAKIAIETPHDGWLLEFSRQHPDLTVKVHNGQWMGQRRYLLDLEVDGSADDWSGEIAPFDDVESVERIDIPPNLRLYRVVERCPNYLLLIRKIGVLMNYPRTVHDGVYTCETTARSSQVRELMGELRSARDRARIVSLQRASKPPNGRRSASRSALTEVQESLFRQALELGYFEVPRRITLTRLAEKVGRSKSAVSHALALVERHLVYSSPLTSPS